MNEIGEDSASINKRSDDAVWSNILAGLRDGGRLKLHHKIGRAVLERLPEKDPRMGRGRTLSISRVRRLEREGVIVQSGTDQYML